MSFLVGNWNLKISVNNESIASGSNICKPQIFFSQNIKNIHRKLTKLDIYIRDFSFFIFERSCPRSQNLQQGLTALSVLYLWLLTSACSVIRSNQILCAFRLLSCSFLLGHWLDSSSTIKALVCLQPLGFVDAFLLFSFLHFQKCCFTCSLNIPTSGTGPTKGWPAPKLATDDSFAYSGLEQLYSPFFCKTIERIVTFQISLLWFKSRSTVWVYA